MRQNWTDDESLTALRLRDRQTSIARIAKSLNRDKPSVKAHLHKIDRDLRDSELRTQA